MPKNFLILAPAPLLLITSVIINKVAAEQVYYGFPSRTNFTPLKPSWVAEIDSHHRRTHWHPDVRDAGKSEYKSGTGFHDLISNGSIHHSRYQNASSSSFPVSTYRTYTARRAVISPLRSLQSKLDLTQALKRPLKSIRSFSTSLSAHSFATAVGIRVFVVKRNPKSASRAQQLAYNILKPTIDESTLWLGNTIGNKLSDMAASAGKIPVGVDHLSYIDCRQLIYRVTDLGKALCDNAP